MTTIRMRRYQELWTHLVELLPSLDFDFEARSSEIVKFEAYRYSATTRGNGYMSWCIAGVGPGFWKKVVVPCLDELRDLRVIWKQNAFNPEAFSVLLPSSRDDLYGFRMWALSGEEEDDTFYWESVYDDDWDYSIYENEAPEYESDNYYKKRGW